MTGHLAWPVALMSVALIFRRQLCDLLGGSLKRLKTGLFEAEWERAESRAAIRVAARSLPTNFSRPHDEDGIDVISRKWSELEAAFLTLTGDEAADTAHVSAAVEDGRVSDPTAHAFEGVRVMRNLARDATSRGNNPERIRESSR